MFCVNCGVALAVDARFCGGCGKSASQSPAPSPVAPLANMPSFGRPQNRWGLVFAANGPFPEGYEWLGELNTLLICRNHLVLVRGTEKRSAALDVVQAMGLMGAVIGAARAAKDSFVTGKVELSAEHAQALLEHKQLVWCNKSDAVIWRYQEKSWLIKHSSEQLYCKFSAHEAEIHACAVLWCTADYNGSAKGDINALGCRIETVGAEIPEKQVHAAFEKSIKGMPPSHPSPA